MSTLIESYGSVALFRNNNGTYVVQDSADTQYVTIKDYGSRAWSGGSIVAADYYNGSRVVVFEGGHVWYADTSWTKSPTGPQGRDTDQFSQEQINSLMLSGLMRNYTIPEDYSTSKTPVEVYGTYHLFQNADGTYTVRDTASTEWVIRDMGSNTPFQGGGSIAAADLYNGYRAVVFQGGHIWYMTPDWQKANVGPNGASTDNISPDQIATYFLTSSPPTGPAVPIGPLPPMAGNRAPVLTHLDTFAIPVASVAPIRMGLTTPTDPDNDVLGIAINSLPSIATVTLDGNPLAVGQILTVAQFTNLSVSKPQGQSNLNDLGTLSFTVTDGKGGMTAGGVRITTVNVALPPTTGNKAPVLNNSSTFAIPASSLTAVPLGLTAPSDPDNDVLGITITSLPTQATVSLNGLSIAVGQTITANQFTNLSVSKSATALNATDLGTLAFTVSDGKNGSVSGSVKITTTSSATPPTNKTGDAGNNTLPGTNGNDTIDGGLGNDTIIGSAGNDTIIGGEGTDQVVYSGSGASVSFQRSNDGSVTLVNGSKTDTLSGVERVTFTDKAYALDLDGSAGKAAKAIIAAFGKNAVSEYLGIAANLTDGGATIEALAKLVVDSKLIPTDPTTFVNTVFANVVGRAPNSLELINFRGMLERGETTPTDLLALAANVPLVEGRLLEITVSGIALEYQPSLF